MATELSTTYDPKTIENPITRRWLDRKAFAAFPDERENRYVIMMPLPNVTGSLHMGHALDNVMQDLLIRWHRMSGDNSLWMPGTDHAGIATQAVIEKRLFEHEGKTRHDIGREALIERIWEWKEAYEKRITEQQRAMGCSCDWDRQRFTMDDVYAPAVREMFFRLFRDGLIYRGSRLVNWDCYLQTAVADDEVEHKELQGHFWHFRYPVVDPQPGEPVAVHVATTRPETMLGDTAVAVHPEPARVLEEQRQALVEKLAGAKAKEKPGLQTELDLLEARIVDHLPLLETLVDMAKAGRKVRLPILDREMPIILDEWAKPGLGSGCVKITPAHDPNDYEVWQRHQDEIGAINLLHPDGTYTEHAGPFAGQDRFEVRKGVVRTMEELGFLEKIEDRRIEIGHSDRSKTIIEPYLSLQWFVRMGDVEGGIRLGAATDKEFRSPGLAQACIDAVSPDWSSPSGRRLEFHPDAVRYRKTYVHWLAEKRDWCISRQLWWGHRIPIWHAVVAGSELAARLDSLGPLESGDVWARVSDPLGRSLSVAEARKVAASEPQAEFSVEVCLRQGVEDDATVKLLEAAGLEQDPDVLDTWFSSQLFPFATLGWPDPEHALVGEGQASLAAAEGKPSALDYYYPGSCLVTGRDIITLWVARMVLAGLYIHGDLPFTDCFLHANIQDGKGERMSKSKGNGIDPVDIIDTYGADAMRYVLCDMQTGMQDIRLPVMAVSPFTGKHIDLTHARHGRSIYTYLDPETGGEFDVLGTIPELPSAKILSDRFEVGRNFCNKLWNAARFALLNLGDLGFEPLSAEQLESEDRWILSRLSACIAEVHQQLEAYNPSAAIGSAREFFWGDLCDWYLELIKPRIYDEARAPKARQVLATVLDQSLRLLHPFLPFITEELWQKLGEQAPVRGIEEALPTEELMALSAWPDPGRFTREEALESEFQNMQEVVRAIRDLRAKYGVSPGQALDCRVKAGGQQAESLERLRDHVETMANLESLVIAPSVERPELAGAQIVGDMEIFLAGVLDPEKERERLEKQKDRLEKGISGTEGKLKNEKFVQRAPEEVVAAEQQRLEDMRKELSLVLQNLAALQ